MNFRIKLDSSVYIKAMQKYFVFIWQKVLGSSNYKHDFLLYVWSMDILKFVQNAGQFLFCGTFTCCKVPAPLASKCQKFPLTAIFLLTKNGPKSIHNIL